MRGIKQRARLPTVKAPRGCKYCLLGWGNPLLQHGHGRSLDADEEAVHCIPCHQRGLDIARLISETLIVLEPTSKA